MAKRDWTREETLLAFLLYCRIPFGKIHKGNPQIIELANLLNRTPSAVGMKMCNLASHDPSQIERGVSGLKNGSKVELGIWSEYKQKGVELIYEAEQLLAAYKNQIKDTSFEDFILNMGEDLDEQIISKQMVPGRDKIAVVKQRVGQKFFHDAVFSSYENKCCITGIAVPSLLIASHIKPWRDSDDLTEKTNPQNGLCLNALHDKAFDQGLITIDKDYRIVVSPKLSERVPDEKTKAWIVDYEGEKIFMPRKFFPGQRFIEYHQDVIFQR